MPRCEGRPGCPCPAGKNDNTVRFTQGDLWLCKACEDFRFPPVGAETRSSKSQKHSTGRQTVSSRKETPTASADATDFISAGVDQPITKLVVNELLSYACFHRNSSSQAALMQVITSYFSPAEITMAKKCLLGHFHESIEDSVFAVERRSSTSRPAHEAEAEDIIGVVDFLDVSDVLKNVTFVAANLSRLPGYGPEQINLCSVVDRQTELQATVEQLAASVEANCCQSESNGQSTVQVSTGSPGLMKTVAMMDKKLDEIRTGIGKLQSGPAKAKVSDKSVSYSREQNIVVFGIAENPEWRKKLTDVLGVVAGREVSVEDALRIGRFTDGKHRPIIVKLRNIWDKRLLISNSRVLSSCSDYMRNVFIAPDESLEDRRKRTIKRLYRNARREQKSTEMSEEGDALFVDDVLVFTLKDGYVGRNNGNIQRTATVDSHGVC